MAGTGANPYPFLAVNFLAGEFGVGVIYIVDGIATVMKDLALCDVLVFLKDGDLLAAVRGVLFFAYLLAL